MTERLYSIYRIPIKEVNGNSYIVSRRNEAIVIDTGVPGHAEEIAKAAEEIGVKIIGIIVTHYHADHTGSLKDLKDLTGAKVYAHELDAVYIAGKEKPPLPQTVPKEVLNAYNYLKKVEPDYLLKDGDRVFGFKVIHVPGHTPGSIALYDGKVLFAGDNLNNREGKIEGTPAIFDWNNNLAKESVKKLLELDFEMLFPGHGEPILEKASELARSAIKLA